MTTGRQMCEWPDKQGFPHSHVKARSYVENQMTRTPWGRWVCGIHEKRALRMGWVVKESAALSARLPRGEDG